jgi:putative ABC transport system ATP-binding protein
MRARSKRRPTLARTLAESTTSARFERLHQQGNTIVLVTHEPDIALHSHRIIHLRDGKVEKDEKIK